MRYHLRFFLGICIISMTTNANSQIQITSPTHNSVSENNNAIVTDNLAIQDNNIAVLPLEADIQSRKIIQYITIDGKLCIKNSNELFCPAQDGPGPQSDLVGKGGFALGILKDYIIKE